MKNSFYLLQRKPSKKLMRRTYQIDFASKDRADLVATRWCLAGVVVGVPAVRASTVDASEASASGAACRPRGT